MGVTLTHEHLQIDLFRITRDRNQRYSRNDIPLILDELSQFKAAGGNTVVEVTNLLLGRDPSALREISEKSGLNIVMGCGWYREPFYAHDYIAQVSTRELTKTFVEEIEHGADGTGIRPGIIGEIGSDLHYVSPPEERVFRASGRAQMLTGLSLTTHALESAVGLQHLDILEDEGVDLRRVIIGHSSTWPDADYHEAIARRGAYVQFDTIRGTFEFDDQRLANLALELIKRGHIDKLLLSHDCCFRTHLRAYGGGGYSHVLTSFVPRLKRMGLSDEQIRILTVENPRRALTGETN
jgi:phosphotriesterase-related protein